jgi:hypothetical protein
MPHPRDVPGGLASHRAARERRFRGADYRAVLVEGT